ncbi:MAG: hypothetical protein AAGB24_05245 [Bacteroidota bacterium]
MKKVVLFMTVMVCSAMGTQAATIKNEAAISTYRYGNSFIFNERGITFSVYPDGEFDFYIDNRVNIGVGARIGNVGITFNSGFDYNPFVQYDDYGAIIQVENVPIYYDYYGRVSQIGGIDIWYRNGRLRRVGGLHVYWNGGVFSHCTGFINIYNRGYVYRPFHRWFVRPAIGFCNVWNSPYRRYYHPIRYTYYRPYRFNTRRVYAKIGRPYRYHQSHNRGKIYRNDRRVAVRENTYRRGDYGRSTSVSSRNANLTNNRVSRNSDNSATRSTSVRQGDVRNKNTLVRRSDSRTTSTKRSITKTPKRTDLTKRQLSSSTNGSTATKSTRTTYKKPKGNSTNRTVVSNNRSQKKTSGIQKRGSTSQKRTVTRSTSTRKSNSSSSRSKSTRIR